MTKEKIQEINHCLAKVHMEIAFERGRWIMYGDNRGFSHSMPQQTNIIPVIEHAFRFLTDLYPERIEQVEMLRSILATRLEDYINLKCRISDTLEDLSRKLRVTPFDGNPESENTAGAIGV